MQPFWLCNCHGLYIIHCFVVVISIILGVLGMISKAVFQCGKELFHKEMLRMQDALIF